MGSVDNRIRYYESNGRVAGSAPARGAQVAVAEVRPASSSSAGVRVPQTNVLDVRWRTLAELSADDLAAWCALEARAAEPNAFLSPHFVLPALRHLDPGLAVRVAWIERREAAAPTLVGVGVLRRSLGSRAFPWPHLTAYLCGHAYVGGLLVDREAVEAAVDALYGDLQRPLQPWQGLELPKADCDGPVARALERAARRHGRPLWRLGRKARAMLDLRLSGEAMLRDQLGKKLNEINRCRRRLDEMGEVTWHCFRRGIPEAAIEAFLQLEHLGWKGEAGTSIRACPRDEAFFREMVAGFDRDGRALFTELRLDGRPIASTCNFVAGTMGFAFKVGWDPALRKLGPGMLNEVEFIRQVRTHCPDLTLFDSGAAADSFISRLWPGRRTMGSLVLPTRPLAALWLGGVQRLRDARQRTRADADIAADVTHKET